MLKLHKLRLITYRPMKVNLPLLFLLAIMIVTASSCMPAKPKAPVQRLLTINQFSLLAATPTSGWYDATFKLNYTLREAKTVSGKYRSIYRSRFIIKGLPATDVLLVRYEEGGKIQFDYFALAAIAPGYFEDLKSQARSAGFTLVEEDEDVYTMVRKGGLKFQMKKQWEDGKEFYFVNFFY